MHFYDFIQVYNLFLVLKNFLFVLISVFINILKLLLELNAFQTYSSYHEIIIHRCNEVKKLILKDLELMNKNSKPYFILMKQPLSCTHLFNILLVFVFVVTIRFGLPEKVWVLHVEISFFYLVFSEFY